MLVVAGGRWRWEWPLASRVALSSWVALPPPWVVVAARRGWSDVIVDLLISSQNGLVRFVLPTSSCRFRGSWCAWLWYLPHGSEFPDVIWGQKGLLHIFLLAVCASVGAATLDRACGDLFPQVFGLARSK